MIERDDSNDSEVTRARVAIGLDPNRYKCIGSPFAIVCRCIHCGTLFGSTSFDLADLDHINRGDCGRPWQH